MTGPSRWTTKIPVERTVAELQAMLGRAGATAVGVTFFEGEPSGMTFTLLVGQHPYGFRLPVDPVAMRVRLLKAHARGELGAKTGQETAAGEVQAARVAWRVVRDWCEAQLALIAAGQARAEQVMLPYVVDHTGVTLYDRWRESEGQLALEAGAS